MIGDVTYTRRCPFGVSSRPTASLCPPSIAFFAGIESNVFVLFFVPELLRLHCSSTCRTVTKISVWCLPVFEKPSRVHCLLLKWPRHLLFGRGVISIGSCLSTLFTNPHNSRVCVDYSCTRGHDWRRAKLTALLIFISSEFVNFLDQRAKYMSDPLERRDVLTSRSIYFFLFTRLPYVLL